MGPIRIPVALPMWDPYGLAIWVRMHNILSSVSKFFYQLFQLPKHRFEKRQNEPFPFFAFILFSVAQCSRKTFQIATERTIYRPWSQKLPSSSKYRSNIVRMRHLAFSVIIFIVFSIVKVILCASEHICSIVGYCFRSFKQL